MAARSGWCLPSQTRRAYQDFVQNHPAARRDPLRSAPAGSRKNPRGLPVGIRSDTMTDDENQELYEAMRSDLETGECALLDDSRSGPTVVRFCRETLGVIDSGSHQERSRPFQTAPQGIFADTRQALRAIRMEMDRRRFWPAIYHVNDHGNVTLLSGSGREVAGWV